MYRNQFVFCLSACSLLQDTTVLWLQYHFLLAKVISMFPQICCFDKGILTVAWYFCIYLFFFLRILRNSKSYQLAWICHVLYLLSVILHTMNNDDCMMMSLVGVLVYKTLQLFLLSVHSKMKSVSALSYVGSFINCVQAALILFEVQYFSIYNWYF